MTYTTQFWLGTKESYYDYRALIETYQNMSVADLKSLQMRQHSLMEDEEDEDDFDNFLLSRVEDLAVITINGQIGAQSNWLTDIFEMPTHDKIYDAFAEAAADESAREIIVYMDTPGGAVSGFSQSLEGINQAKAVKPVHVYGKGGVLSAGLWLASQGTSITMADMSDIGSLGVIGIAQNAAKAMKDAGIETTVVRSASQKAPVTPYERMSEEGLASIKKGVAIQTSRFISGVAEGRGLDAGFVKNKIATGEVFTAEEGVRLGLADKIQGYNDFFRSRLNGGSQSSNAQAPTVAGGWAAAATSIVPNIEGTDMVKKTSPKLVPAADEVRAAAAAEGVTLTEEELNAVSQEEEVTEDESAEVTAEEQGAEGSAGEEATEDQGAEVGAEEEAYDPLVAQNQANSDAILSLTNKYTEAVEQVSALKVENSELKAQAESHSTYLTKFKTITAESINRMNVILGREVQDLSSLSEGNLIEMHSATYAKIVDRFPTGQQASQETGDEVEAAVQNFSEQFAHLTNPSKKVK